MQIIAVANCLFVALVAAKESAEQSWSQPPYSAQRYDGGWFNGGSRGRGNWQNNRGGDYNPNDAGRESGYRTECTCSVNDVINDNLGQLTCDDLATTWRNLKWDDDERACFDENGDGLEENGWGAACQRNHGPNDQWTPANVQGTCSF